MTNKKLLEAAGMEAHQQPGSFFRKVGEAVSSARRNPHEITGAEFNDFVFKQEVKTT